jgi:arylsulfatase A-like enzyme
MLPSPARRRHERLFRPFIAGANAALAGAVVSLMESGLLAGFGTERSAAWNPIWLRLAFQYAVLFGVCGACLQGILPRSTARARIALTGVLASGVLAFHLSSMWIDASGNAASLGFLAIWLTLSALGCFAAPALASRARLRRLGAAAGAGLALVFLAAPPPWSDTQSTSWKGETKAQPANVLMVVIDTLRADHLSAWGYRAPGAPAGGKTSPWIDSLAEQSWRFEQAYAQAPWTRPSVASYLTGLYPQSHGVSTQFDRLHPEVPTLASLLHGAGYRTVGFSANPQVSPTFGLTSGFERFWNPASTHSSRVALRAFRDRILQPVLNRIPRSKPAPSGPPQRGIANATADDVNREVLAWSAQAAADRPTFLYLHYLDPHDPYNAPEDLLYGDPNSVERSDESYFHPHEGMTPRPLANSVMSAVDAQTLRAVQARYDSEIRYVDDRIGKLVEQLQVSGHYRPERDLLILTSDHGEEHYDHQQWLHGWSLFEEMIHVPLIVRGPGFPQGEVHPHPVALVDLMPTVAESLGLKLTSPVHGKSLLNEDALRPTRPIYSHRPRAEHPLDMLLVEGQKLIRVSRDPDAAVWMRFDLTIDPGEQAGLEQAARDEDADLREILEDFRASAGAFGRGAAGKVRLDRAMQDSLRRLGYLSEDEGG